MKPILAGLAACLLLGACSGNEAPPEPQPVPVRIVTVASQAVPNVIELPGRVEPVRVAEVRARVTGIVQQRLYEEGTDVRAGQPLFRIDPRELRASYAQTQAALQRAQATAANARAVVERYRPLVEENAISGQEYDAALAASRVGCRGGRSRARARTGGCWTMPCKGLSTSGAARGAKAVASFGEFWL